MPPSPPPSLTPANDGGEPLALNGLPTPYVPPDLLAFARALARLAAREDACAFRRTSASE